MPHTPIRYEWCCCYCGTNSDYDDSECHKCGRRWCPDCTYIPNWYGYQRARDLPRETCAASVLQEKMLDEVSWTSSRESSMGSGCEKASSRPCLSERADSRSNVLVCTFECLRERGKSAAVWIWSPWGRGRRTWPGSDGVSDDVTKNLLWRMVERFGYGDIGG